MVVGNVSGNFPFFQSPKLLLHCDRPPFSLDTTPPSEDIYKDYYPPICDFSTISEESTFSEESTLNKSASATTPNSSHAHKDLLNGNIYATICFPSSHWFWFPDGFFSFNNISEEEETLDHKYWFHWTSSNTASWQLTSNQLFYVSLSN